MSTVKRTGVLLLFGATMLGCGPSGPAERPPAALHIEEFARGLRANNIWSGGALVNFEAVGRASFAKMIESGLNPDDKVLDVGAGSLRLGWWILHFIEPSNYHAVEPVRSRIDGAAALLGADDIHIYYNEDWEFPDVDFDFVIARSIWTHAAKWMVSKMISEFAENSSPDGKFLTSVRLATSPEEEYLGEEWVGRIVKGDEQGFVNHSLGWIEAECAKHGLRVQTVGELNNQTWVLITAPARRRQR